MFSVVSVCKCVCPEVMHGSPCDRSNGIPQSPYNMDTWDPPIPVGKQAVSLWVKGLVASLYVLLIIGSSLEAPRRLEIDFGNFIRGRGEAIFKYAKIFSCLWADKPVKKPYHNQHEVLLQFIKTFMVSLNMNLSISNETKIFKYGQNIYGDVTKDYCIHWTTWLLVKALHYITNDFVLYSYLKQIRTRSWIW